MTNRLGQLADVQLFLFLQEQQEEKRGGATEAEGLPSPIELFLQRKATLLPDWN